ncbi:hypothetical protein D9Y32_05685 [Bacillus licheniformis]|nr:hypothetical protein D9Y32_05685 [Bacillus licheniformis]
MIILGRNMCQDIKLPKEQPEKVLSTIELIVTLMDGREVKEFFTLFPPIKYYIDDGTWNYDSTLEKMNSLGERFTSDSFLTLLMSHCYENRFIKRLGVGFMSATSKIYKRQHGISVMEKLCVENGIRVYEKKGNEIKPKFYRVK